MADEKEPSGDAFSSLLHPSLPALHRPLPPLSALHYFAPENDDEKRLRLEMGFTTSSDPIIEVEEHDEMEVDPPIPTSARPDASVSINDSANPSGESTTTRPAPSTLDLNLLSSNPVEQIPHATITTPLPVMIPHMADSVAPLPQIPSEKGMLQAAQSAPLQAGSLIGHPAKKGDGSGKRPRSDSVDEQKKAVVPEQALVGDDDEDEPLPEMDSDMDLSDEDEEEEGDE